MNGLPARVVFAVHAVYWISVLSLALSRRASGRRSGLVPAAPVERKLWVGFVPAVAILVAAPAAAAWGGWEGLPLLSGPLAGSIAVRALRGAAAILAVACLACTAVCWRRLGSSWSVASLDGETAALVTGGPFAVVRHPIYALGSVLALATVVVVPSLPVLLAGALYVFLLRRKARFEEEVLGRRHPEEWRSYSASTGFFLPRPCSRCLGQGRLRDQNR